MAYLCGDVCVVDTVTWACSRPDGHESTAEPQHLGRSNDAEGYRSWYTDSSDLVPVTDQDEINRLTNTPLGP